MDRLFSCRYRHGFPLHPDMHMRVMHITSRSESPYLMICLIISLFTQLLIKLYSLIWHEFGFRLLLYDLKLIMSKITFARDLSSRHKLHILMIA